ncbi:MAG: hypothetical protein H6907_01145 [Hyphomicrobiales bacterium]|nr:hypothetical protein [Hyphomicrobiales bacterium]MCP5370311.1 hypothetical protein [Hyphomicrobiales bacterium]
MTRPIGMVLLALAFLAAAAEAYVHALPDGPAGWLVPAAELWAILSPDSLRAAARWTWANLHPWAWDPALVTVLRLPAWLVLGLPGLLLAWAGRRPRDGEYLQAESVFLYDELARAARAEARNPTPLADTAPATQSGTRGRERTKETA